MAFFTGRDSEAQFVAIDDLRLGMFVYLDLGWMKHPFSFNSFKIVSPDQIATLRNLGINRLRWSPEKSDPPPESTAPASPPAEPTKVGAGETATDPADTTLQAAEAPSTVPPEQAARLQRRAKLSRQRESLEACERQFGSALKSYRQILGNVRQQPERASELAQEVVGTMVGKMLDQEESAIRLLSENAGEKASQHTLNVTVISVLLGRAMGLDAIALKQLGTGAILHDIGKLELPERLRWHDNLLNTAERKLYETHVERGLALCRPMKLPPEVLAIVAQHHELADGRGYPGQLGNDAIHPLTRIVALVNYYDNLCNPANPAEAVTPHEALSLIYAQMKKQYDSTVLSSFIRMMGVYPPGSLVELSDGHFGLVVSVNSSRPLKPCIIIHEPRVPREEAPVEDLEHLPNLSIRRSLKPLQLPKATFDYLSPRQRMCYFFERARDPSAGEID